MTEHRDETVELGACEAAARIAAGSLTPSRLLEELLERIDRFDGTIEAWCYLNRDRARAEAAELSQEAAAGRLRGPLHGVPIGLKDVFDAAGMPTLADSRALDDDPASVDATVTARLRAAGALILGKLHTAEFAYADAPPTRNPWNTEHTPGGSSSGSGAAVAARMVPAALGTQTGGSTLRPAAYCGVEALKPTYGRLSRRGLYAVSWTLDHPGIIARGVDDLALLYSVMAGPDPLDDTTLPDAVGSPAQLLSSAQSPPRIGLVRDYFLERSQPVMVSALEDALARLEAAGATVKEVALPPEFALVPPAHRLIIQTEAAAVHAARYAERAERYGPRLAINIEAGSLIPAGHYLQAQRVRRQLRTLLLALFADVDVLAMPTAPGPAPEGIDSTGDASLLSPWSFVGYPAASVACGLSPAGLPLGLQLVSPPLTESTLLSAASWSETVLGRLPMPSLLQPASAR